LLFKISDSRIGVHFYVQVRALAEHRRKQDFAENLFSPRPPRNVEHRSRPALRRRSASVDSSRATNINRFPADFLFQLTADEHKNLKSQFVISSWGGARTAPYAFTEQGVAMLSSVCAVRAPSGNIAIMRTFVRLREMLATNQKLRRKIEDMEKRYDAKLQIVFATIESMLEDEDLPKRASDSMPPRRSQNEREFRKIWPIKY